MEQFNYDKTSVAKVDFMAGESIAQQTVNSLRYLYPKILPNYIPAFTCSKLTIETLEQGVKYVQS